MSTGYTVGQYLVDRLHQLGMGHLFSIAGDYSIVWVNRYVVPSKIQVIEEVNELNGGFAADAYARLKGIGALCVTYSVGSLCAANCIAGAYVEKVPLVLINGAPNTKRTLAYEQTGFMAHHFISGRQTDLQVFEPITVAAVRIDNPDLAPLLIDYALTQCITERRPVYIELLEDMIDLECKPAEGKLSPARPLPNPAGQSLSIQKIKEKLETAAHPLLWVGVEIDRYGLHELTHQLIQKLKIPYVTELISKAIISEDDPHFAGVYTGKASSKPVQDLVEESDFILALGVWLTDINTLGWDPDFNFETTPVVKTAFVSWDTVKYGSFFSPQVALGLFMEGLLAVPVTCKPQALPQGTGHEAPMANLGDRITYQGFYDFISQYVDKNTIIGSDPSMNYFGTLLLKVGAPRGYFAQPSYSSIGYIAPAATGICLAKEKDQRVMVFSGDGGFQTTAQCLSTQTRFQLNPIIFVIDNGVYAVEQWLADASVFHSDKTFYHSCILHPWNYSKLADVFGCRGWKAETYGELKDAMTGALANSNSPSLIQVMVPDKSIPSNATWKAQ